MGSYKLGYTGDKVQQILEKADNLPINDPAAGFTKGMILMWSGSITAVPDGWALCNGQNGTPNLMDKFVVGAGSSYTIGSTGGSATVSLTEAQLASHGHTGNITLSEGGAHSHSITVDGDNMTGSFNNGSSYSRMCFPDGGDVGTNDSGSRIFISTGSGGAHSHTGTAAIQNAGSGEAHENRPPYYALAYIMKL